MEDGPPTKVCLRAIGHKKGAENVESILGQCIDLNIEQSDALRFLHWKNWDRPVVGSKSTIEPIQILPQ